MKKSILLSAAFMFLLAFNINASDATVTIEQLPPQLPGEVTIPVNVDFSSVDVCAIDIFLVFDQDVLTNPEVINFALGTGTLSENLSPIGQYSINITWTDDFPFSGTNLEGKLFDLKFDYDGGSTDIDFFFVTVPPDGNTYTEIGDCSFDPVDTEFNGASIEQAPAPVPLAIWGLGLAAGFMFIFVSLRVLRVF